MTVKDYYELMINAKGNEQLMEVLEKFFPFKGYDIERYFLVNNYGFILIDGQDRIDVRHIVNVYGVSTDYIQFGGKSFKNSLELIEAIKTQYN